MKTMMPTKIIDGKTWKLDSDITSLQECVIRSLKQYLRDRGYLFRVIKTGREVGLYKRSILYGE